MNILMKFLASLCSVLLQTKGTDYCAECVRLLSPDTTESLDLCHAVILCVVNIALFSESVND